MDTKVESSDGEATPALRCSGAASEDILRMVKDDFDGYPEYCEIAAGPNRETARDDGAAEVAVKAAARWEDVARRRATVRKFIVECFSSCCLIFMISVSGFCENFLKFLFLCGGKKPERACVIIA